VRAPQHPIRIERAYSELKIPFLRIDLNFIIFSCTKITRNRVFPFIVLNSKMSFSLKEKITRHFYMSAENRRLSLP